jgi:hypothetical protein
MDILNKIDWWHIFTVVAAFLIGLLIKTLLDFNLAKIIVKRLYWFPTRFIFRQKPIDLSGDWEQIWDFSENESYSKDIDRHSHTTMKQFGSYCYCEFYSQNEKYYFFGTISDNYVFGKWRDYKDKQGYFGTFQLRIVNSKKMEGKWIGHSKSTQSIYSDNWTWNKKD